MNTSSLSFEEVYVKERKELEHINCGEVQQTVESLADSVMARALWNGFVRLEPRGRLCETFSRYHLPKSPSVTGQI